MNSREIKNIDINEITEELIFLGLYEENRKESCFKYNNKYV